MFSDRVPRGQEAKTQKCPEPRKQSSQMLQHKAAPPHPPFPNYLPLTLHKLNLLLYRHESLPYALGCWAAQGSGLTQEIQEH